MIYNITGTIQTTTYSKSQHHTTVKALGTTDTQTTEITQLVLAKSTPVARIRNTLAVQTKTTFAVHNRLLLNHSTKHMTHKTSR